MPAPARQKGTSKNGLRCHRGVKNRLVRESDQIAHFYDS